MSKKNEVGWGEGWGDGGRWVDRDSSSKMARDSEINFKCTSRLNCKTV